MNPHIIIVTGYLAAGKSTFARRLSEALNVPYLIKDTFKIALCESASVISREESSRLSRTADRPGERPRGGERRTGKRIAALFRDRQMPVVDDLARASGLHQNSS